MNQIIVAIVGIVKIITLVDKWLPALLQLFEKDPVKQVTDDERKHEDAAKKAERGDDTSGSFGS